MNAIRYVLRPPMTGPCNASPVQRSFGVAASNRPNPCGGRPSGRVFSSRRAKWRCSVRGEGTTPAGVLGQDRSDLRGGASGDLPLQRGRQLQHLRRGASARRAARRGPGRRTRRPATPGSTGPGSPATPGPSCPSGRRARRPRAGGPAPRAGGSSTPRRRPHGSTHSGTGRYPGPARPACPHCRQFCVGAPSLTPCRVVRNCVRSERGGPDQARQGSTRVAHHPTPASGASSRPAEARAANSHGPTGANLTTTAAAARPIASTASATTEPRGVNADATGSSACSRRVNVDPRVLRPGGEPAQPAPHRRHRTPRRRRERPVPLPGGLALQRGADHHDRVRPAEQPQGRQQHVRAPTRGAPRPPWLVPHRPRRPPRGPRPGIPPRPQHPRTRRTRQLARHQQPLDLDPVGTYHQHGCPPSTK